MSKILIIDDDKQVIKTLIAVINRYMPEVETFPAFDGMEGIQLIRNSKPDLIILDINLPSVSGHTICRSIKADRELKNIPILIITGEGSDLESKIKSLDYGAEAFLKKPFDIPEFIAQIKSLLRLKRAEDELLEERDMLRIDVMTKEKLLEKNYQDIKNLFESFMEVMATSIDALSIYNYDSTRKVAEMLHIFFEYIKKNGNERLKTRFADIKKQENMIMAAWLHDIGKISIPCSLLNKFTRLGDLYNAVTQRLETIFYYLISENAETEMFGKWHQAREIVERLNNPQNEVTEDDHDLLMELSGLIYTNPLGEKVNWFSEKEIACLSIRNGTLTDDERKVAENHVKMTNLLLSKIPFPEDKQEIREWCNNHHELLDGSGYYQGLIGDQISIETRVLTIVDIFEALTSDERPYKKHYSPDEAIVVLEEMVSDGKLDEELVTLFKASRAWEIPGR